MEEIKITKAWIERLKVYTKKCEEATEMRECGNESEVNALLGYLASLEVLISKSEE